MRWVADDAVRVGWACGVRGVGGARRAGRAADGATQLIWQV